MTRANYPNVDVYEPATFGQTRSIPSCGFNNPSGIASCVNNSYLFICDSGTYNIYRIHVPSNVSTSWNVGYGQLMGLCVNRAHNVIVTSSSNHIIREYTPDGGHVRDINLHQTASIVSPYNAYQINDDQYVVSYQHCVAIVKTDGSLVSKYGNPSTPGTADGQLSSPRQVILSKNGCFLVADYGNNRIVVLGPRLEYFCELPLGKDGGLQGPWSIFLDETRGRLYVGEYNGRRVLVFDDVYNPGCKFMYDTILGEKEQLQSEQQS